MRTSTEYLTLVSLDHPRLPHAVVGGDVSQYLDTRDYWTVRDSRDAIEVTRSNGTRWLIALSRDMPNGARTVATLDKASGFIVAMSHLPPR